MSGTGGKLLALLVTCIHTEEYLGKIVCWLSLIFGVKLGPKPEVLLLGLPSPNIKRIPSKNIV